jgi:hypothetical protein
MLSWWRTDRRISEKKDVYGSYGISASISLHGPLSLVAIFLLGADILDPTLHTGLLPRCAMS